MNGAGTKDRERFLEAMEKIAVGAKLRRRKSIWTVVKQRRRETSMDLTIQCGRRTMVASVMVSHWGPDLHHAGLSAFAPAPTQRELSLPGGA